MSFNTVHSLASPFPPSLTPLTTLLSRYSTGLSLCIAHDEISTIHTARPPPDIWHTITHVLPSPRTWVFHNNLAFFPPTHYHKIPVAIGSQVALLDIVNSDAAVPIVRNLLQAEKAAKTASSPTDVAHHAAGVSVNAVAVAATVAFALPENRGCSLRDVWDCRIAEPYRVHACVIHVSETELHLVDCLNERSPVVKCLLPPGKKLHIAGILQNGSSIVLEHPLVQPMNDSFCLAFAPGTILHCNPLPKPPPPRPVQQDKVPLFSHLTPVSPPTAIYHRVLHAPLHEKNHVRLRVSSATIRVQGRYDGIKVGDELVIHAVRHVQSVEMALTQTEQGWMAAGLTDLSAMTAVLYAPFARNVFRVSALKCRFVQWVSAHVNVCIADMCLDDDRLCLTLTDAKEQGQKGCLKAVVTEPCFDQLGISKHVLSEDSLLEKDHRAMSETWIMTLTIPPGDNAIPNIRACVRGLV